METGLPVLIPSNNPNTSTPLLPPSLTHHPPPPPPNQPLVYQPQPPTTQSDDFLNNLFRSLKPEELEDFRKDLDKRMVKLGRSCVLSHMVGQLHEHGFDNINIASKISEVYSEFSRRNAEQRQGRIFEHMCTPCMYIKFGLLFENTERTFQSSSCMLNPSRDGNTKYNLGPFIHGISTFQIDGSIHPTSSNINDYSRTVAFPKGSLILPTSNIMMQILALNPNKTCHGIKICMIESDEENVDEILIQKRFLARNLRLDCGYYARNKNLDMTTYNFDHQSKRSKKKLLNKKKKKKDDANENDEDEQFLLLHKDLRDYLINLGISKNGGESDNSDDGTSSSTDDDDDDYGLDPRTIYIDKFDSSPNKDDIFKNGEPLTFVEPDDDPYKPNDIGMRIFDVNPTLIAYIKSMINLQSHNEKKFNSLNLNPYERQSLKRSPMINLLTHTYYDLMCYAFQGIANHDKLLEIPPLNGKCMLADTNILFVNRSGKPIMVAKAGDKASKCDMYNYLIKLMDESPLSHKLATTVSNTTLNARGNAPPSKFSIKAVKGWLKAVEKYEEALKAAAAADDDDDDDIENAKATHCTLLSHHADMFRNYHSNLKSSRDILKHYFCEFQDDTQENMTIKGNEFIFDLARKMYPQYIIDAKSNRHAHSLDYSEKHIMKPIIDCEIHPNVVYIPNLGFVALKNICNGSLLVLKNTTVYFQNIVNRFSDQRNSYFVAASNKNCKLNSSRKRKMQHRGNKQNYCNSGGCYSDDDDDDEEGGSGNYSQKSFATDVNVLPPKRVFENNVVNVCGVDSNYDHMAFMRMQHCHTPSFKDYLKAFSVNPENSSCLRQI